MLNLLDMLFAAVHKRKFTYLIMFISLIRFQIRITQFQFYVIAFFASGLDYFGFNARESF